MKILFALFSFIVIGMIGAAYAEPLEEITVTVLDTSPASVNISWNHDDSVSEYKAGCVSCIPNVEKKTTSDTVMLDKVTSMKNGLVLLYVIAFDDSGDVLAAKQVVTELK